MSPNPYEHHALSRVHLGGDGGFRRQSPTSACGLSCRPIWSPRSSPIAALIGYFSLVPGTYDLFTEFGRARGTFKDPNVLGAFLVPALLYAFNW